MKTNILNISVLLVCMAFCSCGFGKNIKGNGNIVTREFRVGEFDGIELSVLATVNYTVGDKYSCIVHVDENILDCLGIRISEGKLKLENGYRYRSVNLQPTKCVIELISPKLKSIDVLGSGDVNVLSDLVGRKMSVGVAGSGDVVFNETLDFGEFKIKMAGSGDVRTLKHADLQKVNIETTGLCSVVMNNAEVLHADMEVAGSSKVTVNGVVKVVKVRNASLNDVVLGVVTDRIDYRIKGTGDILYGGIPAVLKGKKVGRGNILQK